MGFGSLSLIWTAETNHPGENLVIAFGKICYVLTKINFRTFIPSKIIIFTLVQM